MHVFLFTDIEDSTRLWEEHTAEMGAVIARHDALLQERVGACGGRVSKHTGDGITAVFEGGDPVRCALEAQVWFAREPWGAIGELRIRVGLHAGKGEWIAGVKAHEGDYFGPPVNCAARIMSAAWGGQILLSPEVTRHSRLPRGATLLDLGEHLLKGVSAPQQIYQLLHPDLRRMDFPPPRTLSGQSIRRVVEEQGAQMVDLDPAGVITTIVSATLLPVVQGNLSPGSGALAGSLGALQDLGAETLAGLLAEFVGHQPGGDSEEVRQQLEAELQWRWGRDGAEALALRADASRLLQALGGADVILTSAAGEVREALAALLAGLGMQFGEFRWVLGDVQETLAEVRELQEQQLELQRRQLERTELLLEQQEERTRISGRETDWQPLFEAERPAFLEEGARDVGERPVFVAREGELARLAAWLDGVLAGHGKVVFVTGGPGRGKTALLSEFARLATQDHRDLLVVRGDCDAYSGLGDPYLPWREAMGMLTGEVEASWAAGVIGRDEARRVWMALPHVLQALLAHGPNVVPALVPGEALLARATAACPGAGWLRRLRERVGQGLEGADGLEQSHLFQQVSNVLRAVAAEHPLLLILDDLQWADAASVGLLFHLGRRLEGSRILIAGAYRPEEVALGQEGEGHLTVQERRERVPDLHLRVRQRHPIEKLLTEFKRLYGDVWLDLSATGDEDGRRFVDAYLETMPNRLDECFRAALWRHTEGHALFTTELLRAMQERGDLMRDEDGQWVETERLDWEAVPARVEGVIEERLGRLGGDLREMLTVASVEGGEFTAQVVARVLGLKERAALQRLSRELEGRHRLVRESHDPLIGCLVLSRYHFSHALFQTFLYEEISPGERRLLHGEVGRALEALAQSCEDCAESAALAVQLARHFRKAQDKGKAVEYLLQAGEQAQKVYANDEAISQFRQAIELLPVQDQATRPRLAQLHERIGDLLSLGSRHEAARKAYGQAMACLAAEDTIGHARLCRKTGSSWLGQHDYARAEASYEGGLSRLGSAPEAPSAEWWQSWLDIQAARVGALYFQARLDELDALCRRSRPVVEKYGSARQRAEFLNSLVQLQLRQLRFVPSPQVISDAESALAWARQTPNRSAVLDIEFRLAFTQLWWGDLQAAADRLDGLRRQAERMGNLSMQMVCLTYLGVAHRLWGNLDLVRYHSARCSALAGAVESPIDSGVAHGNLSWLAYREADLDGALQHGQAALEQWGELAYPFRWLAYWPLLAVELARDGVAAAIDQARAMLDPLQQRLPDQLADALGKATEAWDDGQPSSARGHLARAVHLAGERGHL